MNTHIRTIALVAIVATLTILGTAYTAGAIVTNFLDRHDPVQLNKPATYRLAGYLPNGKGITGVPYGSPTDTSPAPRAGGNGGNGGDGGDGHQSGRC
jgi:hypothetical protein